jgi:hypothetical protein
MKSAAIKKEFINDFTKEELQQFKKANDLDQKIKKIYDKIDFE